MVESPEINALESIIVENAGPMGKFVIKKSMADLGLEPGSINQQDKSKLLDMVLERAVFDKDKWPGIRREILDAWGGAND